MGRTGAPWIDSLIVELVLFTLSVGFKVDIIHDDYTVNNVTIVIYSYIRGVINQLL
jgi:hypothetical protein